MQPVNSIKIEITVQTENGDIEHRNVLKLLQPITADTLKQQRSYINTLTTSMFQEIEHQLRTTADQNTKEIPPTQKRPNLATKKPDDYDPA